MFIARFSQILFVLVFTGCSLIPITPARWAHPSKSQAGIKGDHLSCLNDAWLQYPVKMGYISAENSRWENPSYATTTCSTSPYTHKTYCTHVPATTGHMIEADMIKGDENAKNRANFYASCMSNVDKEYKCLRNGVEVHGSWCGKYTE